VQPSHHSKATFTLNGSEGGKAPLSGRYAAQCAGAIQGKEGGIQVLAGLAPSSQIVGTNIRLIHEQVKRGS
jgi:hypothetical protein